MGGTLAKFRTQIVVPSVNSARPGSDSLPMNCGAMRARHRSCIGGAARKLRYARKAPQVTETATLSNTGLDFRGGTPEVRHCMAMLGTRCKRCGSLHDERDSCKESFPKTNESQVYMGSLDRGCARPDHGYGSGPGGGKSPYCVRKRAD